MGSSRGSPEGGLHLDDSSFAPSIAETSDDPRPAPRQQPNGRRDRKHSGAPHDCFRNAPNTVRGVGARPRHRLSPQIGRTIPQIIQCRCWGLRVLRVAAREGMPRAIDLLNGGLVVKRIAKGRLAKMGPYFGDPLDCSHPSEKPGKPHQANPWTHTHTHTHKASPLLWPAAHGTTKKTTRPQPPPFKSVRGTAPDWP